MDITMDVEYAGNLRTRAIHGPSGAELQTAAPVDNHGDGSSFSPTDLFATSLATCTLTIMAIAARRLGRDLDGARARVTKVMSAGAPRRIVRLPVTITLPSGVPVAMREALEEAARACPVHASLRADLEAPITFVWE